MKDCPRSGLKNRKFNPYEMHYVQELIIIISDVQIVQIIFLSPLDSVSALIAKNFWHFLIYQQLLKSFRQLFSASILPHSQVLFYKHVLLRISIKKNQVVSDQKILEVTQLFHASQSICSGKFHPVIFVSLIQNALELHLAETTHESKLLGKRFWIAGIICSISIVSYILELRFPSIKKW